MDDALFKLWQANTCTVEDVLSKSHRPDDLAKRIVNARQGIFDAPTGDPEAA
jgi:twitching motility protein PilT